MTLTNSGINGESQNENEKGNVSPLSSPTNKVNRKHHHLGGIPHPHLHRRQFSWNANENAINKNGENEVKRKMRPPRLMSLGNAKEMGQNGLMKDARNNGSASGIDDLEKTPLASTTSISVSEFQNSNNNHNNNRKPSLPGAKPVAPSWHPNAPDGLKVHQPPDALLLPDLPVAGITSASSSQQNLNQQSKDGRGSQDSGKEYKGMSIQDRIVDLSTAAPRLEHEKVMESESVKLQRPSIKVRIITWNQGNSVPKGDLGVLLGRVGEYIAPEAGWDESSDEEDNVDDDKIDPKQNKDRKHKGMGVPGQEGIPRKDRIPPLPHDDAHPYHIVVIAGQECPWGDGKRISTGVGLAGELGDLSRSKSRAQQIAKEREREAKAKEKEKESNSELKEKHSEIPKTPGVIVTNDEDPFNELNPFPSAPQTPGLTSNLNKNRGTRGWSEMCEDWFCRGPLAQATATKGLALASNVNNNNDKVSNTSFFPHTPEEGMSPISSRAQTPNPRGFFATNGLSTPRSLLSPDSSQISLPLSPSNSSLPTMSEQLETPSRRVGLLVPKRVMRSISKQRIQPEEQMPNISASLASSNQSLSLDTADIGENSLVKEGILECSSPTTQPISPIKQSIDANVRQFSNPQGLGLTLHGSENFNNLPSTEQGSSSSRPPFGITPATSTNSIPTITSVPITPAAKKTQHRLAIRIPGLSGAHQVTVQSDGTPSSLGAYELVCKERCYMMYMAVYVWRGCLDRIRGHSQGHVKCGLLNSRIGNKGAVGISLKLGSTRLLFVNAHLAAHEGRVAERIANVEKIKKELKVDTFLPKDDPRNEADDLTTCFDYAYWFGDLNFRVDITRKHADWLMKNHQYDHALCFDQLRKVMRERPEIFNGFKEAPITFPPTFKYDVLKTIKAKKNEERIAAREGKVVTLDTLSSEFQNDVGDQSNDTAHLHTPTVPPSSSGHTLTDFDDDDNSSISSAIHSSSAGNISEADESSNATSPDSPKDVIVANNTAAAEGLGVHGKVIKARKRIFSLVHSAVGAVANENRDERHSQPRRNTDSDRKRFSSGQQISEPIKIKDNKRSSGSVENHTSTQRILTNDSQLSGSIERSMAKSQNLNGSSLQSVDFGGSSSLEKTDALTKKTSGVVFADEVKSSDNASAEGHEGDISIEEQPYDTSSKQRVPSWCDRVLWKSNISVQPDEGEINEGLHLESNRPSRLSAALANAFSKFHVKSDMIQSPALDSAGIKSNENYRQSPQTFVNSAGTVIPPTSMTPTQPKQILHSPPSPSSPKRRWYGKGRLPSNLSNEADQRPKAFRRSTTIAGIEPLSAFDPLESRQMTKRTMSANEIKTLSKSADNDHIAFGPSADLSTDSNGSELIKVQNREKLRKSNASPTLSPRRTSLNIERYRRQKDKSSPQLQKTIDPLVSSPSKTESRTSLNMNLKSQRNSNADSINENKINSNLTRSQTEFNENSPRRSSRWNDLLSPLFNSQNSVANALANFAFRSGMTNQQPMDNNKSRNNITNLQNSTENKTHLSELIGPRKGEIECLLYKSLNDREMRMLEGRSDHRPVIFVSSIGVGISSPKATKWKIPKVTE